MRYQIPQFIEIEDRVIGPLTLKQFVYLAGGAGMAFIVYLYVPLLLLKIILIPAVIGLAVALAFYKSNNRPFIEVLEAMFNFYTREKLYVWRKEQKKIIPKTVQNTSEAPQLFVPKLSESKLKDLAWSLDINENANPLTGQDGKNTK